MQATITYLETLESGEACLRIVTPSNDTRTPTHFIALIDVSDSMQDDGKLNHVKHCMSLLLKFLSPADYLSLVTFGDESTIILNHVKADEANSPVMENAISHLSTDGCTNYSAGLCSVREILDAAAAAGCTAKPGLLSLTDGHANRGTHTPLTLGHLVTRIHELYPALAFSFVAYGTNHNAPLLKSMSDAVMGSYSIVENMEGAAVAMGDCLGGIISCVAQNVAVHLPPGTVAHGPYTVGSDGKLALGDLYSDSTTTILLNIPAGVSKITGTLVPSLDPLQMDVVVAGLDTSRNVEIDVTRLRYRCADLFRQIRESMASRAQNTDLAAKIEAFRVAINDEVLATHPVIEMLKTELQSLTAALENMRTGALRGLESQLYQHEAFTSMMRGTTTTILPDATPHVRRGARVRFGSTASDPDSGRPPSPTPMASAMCSPTASTRQRQVTNLMRMASQTPAPPHDDSE